MDSGVYCSAGCDKATFTLTNNMYLLTSGTNAISHTDTVVFKHSLIKSFLHEGRSD